jgi:pimeloyl-ACP methyl ester carboxylesterase
MVWRWALAAFVLLLQAGYAAGQPLAVQGGPWRLEGRVYESAHLSAHPHLILVLHGDAPFENPSYHYVFARRAAEALADTVAVGLLRPGYKDGLGGRSQGIRGWTNGDNYTRDTVADIAAAARALVQRYRAGDLTLVGHSGGATIAADIAALYPHLAKRVLLVSCPCDVTRFRWSMLKLQLNPIWLLPVWSLSPQDYVGQVPRDTVVRLVVGANDVVAPPPLTFAYADALKRHGGDVAVFVLKDAPHDILLEPAVLEQLRLLMAAR